MPYYVYILRSETNGKYYVGYTHDPAARLKRHNEGWTRSTKGRGRWKLVYLERYEEKGLAIRREKQIKRMKKG